MIEISVFRTGQQIEGFKISGHSRLARKGEDICCAAVSAVSQTALAGLLMQLDSKPEYEIKEGWLEVHLKDFSSATDLDKAQIIMSTMEAGLRMIADEYSRAVRMKDEHAS